MTKGKSWCVWYKVSKLWRHSWCTIHVDSELGRVYLSIDPLPEILEACLKSLFADHVIGLRLALIPGHRDQGPRSHVMKSLISYGEPLRQVWPWTNARDHGVLAVTSINWRRRLGLFIRSSSPHSQSRDILVHETTILHEFIFINPDKNSLNIFNNVSLFPPLGRENRSGRVRSISHVSLITRL